MRVFIKIVGTLLVTALLIGGTAFIIGKGLMIAEIADCEVLQEQRDEYELFFPAEWEIEMCDYHGINVRAYE